MRLLDELRMPSSVSLAMAESRAIVEGREAMLACAGVPASEAFRVLLGDTKERLTSQLLAGVAAGHVMPDDLLASTAISRAMGELEGGTVASYAAALSENQAALNAWKEMIPPTAMSAMEAVQEMSATGLMGSDRLSDLIAERRLVEDAVSGSSSVELLERLQAQAASAIDVAMGRRASGPLQQAYSEPMLLPKADPWLVSEQVRVEMPGVRQGEAIAEGVQGLLSLLKAQNAEVRKLRAEVKQVRESAAKSAAEGRRSSWVIAIVAAVVGGLISVAAMAIAG